MPYWVRKLANFTQRVLAVVDPGTHCSEQLAHLGGCASIWVHWPPRNQPFHYGNAAELAEIHFLFDIASSLRTKRMNRTA